MIWTDQVVLIIIKSRHGKYEYLRSTGLKMALYAQIIHDPPPHLELVYELLLSRTLISLR